MKVNAKLKLGAETICLLAGVDLCRDTGSVADIGCKMDWERRLMGTIIIGAGHGGGTAAALLRQNGYAEPIILIGEEPHPPYQRPPLSKAWLKGHAERDDLLLRPDSFYVEQNITLRLGAPVTAVDAAARKITVGDQTLHYDHLALTTGTCRWALSTGFIHT